MFHIGICYCCCISTVVMNVVALHQSSKTLFPNICFPYNIIFSSLYILFCFPGISSYCFKRLKGTTFLYPLDSSGFTLQILDECVYFYRPAKLQSKNPPPA